SVDQSLDAPNDLFARDGIEVVARVLREYVENLRLVGVPGAELGEALRDPAEHYISPPISEKSKQVPLTAGSSSLSESSAVRQAPMPLGDNVKDRELRFNSGGERRHQVDHVLGRRIQTRESR